MKKTLALILAAMMVAGTASVAFATPKEDLSVDATSPYYVWKSSDGYYSEATSFEYGDRVAMLLEGDLIDSKDDETKNINKFRVFADWKVGSSLVEDMDIEYKKVEKSVTGAYKGKDVPSAPKMDVSYNGEVYTVTLSTTKATDFVGESEKAAKIEALVKTRVESAVKKDDSSDAKAVLDNLKAEILKDNDLKEKVFGYYYEKDTAKTDKKYAWVAYVDLKDSNSTKMSDLVGTIRVAKTTSADAEKVDFEIEVGYGKEEVTDSVTYDDDKPVLDFDDIEDVIDIEFGESGNDALFTVDVTGQGKVNVKFDTKFDADIAAKYPEANLEFVRWSANPTFNRTGDLYIYADEDTFLYEVTADGLKEVSKAEYDEDYGAWYLRTRRLGTYVISDTELDLSASSSSGDASSSGTSSSNPTTGGTTGTTGGNPGDKYNPNTGR